MSDSQSDYEQQFGIAANAAGIAALLGPLAQMAKHFHSKYKPDPKKNLEKVQQELESFNVLLEREKNVVTGDEFEEFEKRYMRIQYKIQKETDRISTFSGSRSERQESMENIRRISGTIQKVRKEFVTSSANARKLRSTSTIHIEVEDSTTIVTPNGLAGFSRRVWEMCTSGETRSSVLPTHMEPNTLRGGGSLQPTPASQNNAGYYLAFTQEDGTERLVHSEDLKNDPSIAPELVNAIMRTVEAHQQGAPVVSTPDSLAHPTQSELPTGNTGIPTYRVNLDRVPEFIDGEEARGHGNV